MPTLSLTSLFTTPFLATALVLATALPSAAERCLLDVVSSEDATSAEMRTYHDGDFTQVVLTSFHRFEDESTITVSGASQCEDATASRCIGLVVEGLFPGDERSYWFTEVRRSGDQVTVVASGFYDAEMTEPQPEAVYTDIYSVRRCTDS